MKLFTILVYLSVLVSLSFPAFSQKYITIEDSATLSKEYINICNDITDLNAKLTIAQNDLPDVQSKAKKANDEAVDAVSASSEQACKATNGNVRDAKNAKRKAKKAYHEAKDYRSAKSKVPDQENKITRYKVAIKKRQQRLEELEVLRVAINSKYSTDSIPHLKL